MGGVQVQNDTYTTLGGSSPFDVELWVPHLPLLVQALGWVRKTYCCVPVSTGRRSKMTPGDALGLPGQQRGRG